MNKIRCCEKTLDFFVVDLPNWAAYRFMVSMCLECDTIYEKKIDSMSAYRKDKHAFVCTHCDSEVLEALVAHPIWDGPFPMSGRGKCLYEPVPYCPQCDEKPRFNGAPIETNFNPEKIVIDSGGVRLLTFEEAYKNTGLCLTEPHLLD